MCSNRESSENSSQIVGEKMIKDQGESFFQRFVTRTRAVRKSPSILSGQSGASTQQRPGLLTTLFGNPIQIFRKRQAQQHGSSAMERQPSYALVRTNQFEEGHDFEVCDELIMAASASASASPSPIAVANGVGNNFYRPPRSYHHRALVVSTMHNPEVVVDLPKHALKSEVRVLSAPYKQTKPVRLPPTPPKTAKKLSTVVAPSTKISTFNGGAPTRKISAPAGPPSRMVHQPVTKKISMAGGTAPLQKRSARGDQSDR